jgi:hypothetical protein
MNRTLDDVATLVAMALGLDREKTYYLVRGWRVREALLPVKSGDAQTKAYEFSEDEVALAFLMRKLNNAGFEFAALKTLTALLRARGFDSKADYYVFVTGLGTLAPNAEFTTDIRDIEHALWREGALIFHTRVFKPLHKVIAYLENPDPNKTLSF